jgi:hypothetical protein
MRRRPSPALLVAILALVIACGGSATAASLITSKNVKDRSLLGKDMKSSTVTGRNVANLSGRDIIPNGLDGSDIDEETLDRVPNAQTAQTAHSLKGIKTFRISYRALADTAPSTVFEASGVRVEAGCPGGTLEVNATSTATAGGLLRVAISHEGAPAETTVLSDNEFLAPDAVSLVTGGADNLTGTLTYMTPPGETLTVQYLTQSGIDGARGYTCVFAGTGIRTT